MAGYRHILVLDDEAEIVKLFLKALPRIVHFAERYTFKGFPSAESILSWMESDGQGAQIPLVIADYDLGSDLITGIDVLRRVRSLSPKTRRVLFSGCAGRDALSTAVNEGLPHAFLDKPAMLSQLSQTINSLIEDWENQWRRGTCFVIMPFNHQATTVYASLLKPAIEELGFQCVRQDERRTMNRQVVDDTVKNIREASLIIAEISSPNPNVYYELGIAHALSKPVILFSTDTEGAPFDVRNFRIAGYDPTAKSSQAIRDEICAALDEIDRHT